LLQDDNWQTINRYSADESGVISFETTNEFINYTLVAKNQQGTEAEGLNVVSFYQASSNAPAHYQANLISQWIIAIVNALLKILS
jgi:hypothetical protein